MHSIHMSSGYFSLDVRINCMPVNNITCMKQDKIGYVTSLLAVRYIPIGLRSLAILL